jgi:WhiB family transcriptional regulator, redox-sensing transcriptional regulator
VSGRTVVGIDEDMLIGAMMRGVDVPELRLTRPAWHAFALCRGQGVEAFFLPKGADVRPTKALCASCPVQGPCLDAGRGEAGIWGGTSERERRRLRHSAA